MILIDDTNARSARVAERCGFRLEGRVREDHRQPDGSLTGTFDSTERLLSKTMPKERVAQIMEEIRGPAGRTMWDKLGNVNEAVLANYLKNEYPLTVHLNRIKQEIPIILQRIFSGR